jgi:hypothetical protein
MFINSIGYRVYVYSVILELPDEGYVPGEGGDRGPNLASFIATDLAPFHSHQCTTCPSTIF